MTEAGSDENLLLKIKYLLSQDDNGLKIESTKIPNDFQDTHTYIILNYYSPKLDIYRDKINDIDNNNVCVNWRKRLIENIVAKDVEGVFGVLLELPQDYANILINWFLRKRDVIFSQYNSTETEEIVYPKKTCLCDYEYIKLRSNDFLCIPASKRYYIFINNGGILKITKDDGQLVSTRERKLTSVYNDINTWISTVLLKNQYIFECIIVDSKLYFTDVYYDGENKLFEKRFQERYSILKTYVGKDAKNIKVLDERTLPDENDVQLCNYTFKNYLETISERTDLRVLPKKMYFVIVGYQTPQNDYYFAARDPISSDLCVYGKALLKKGEHGLQNRECVLSCTDLKWHCTKPENFTQFKEPVYVCSEKPPTVNSSNRYTLKVCGILLDDSKPEISTIQKKNKQPTLGESEKIYKYLQKKYNPAEIARFVKKYNQ